MEKPKTPDADAQEEALEGAAQPKESFRPSARADTIVTGAFALGLTTGFYARSPESFGAVFGCIAVSLASFYRATRGDSETYRTSVWGRLGIVALLFLMAWLGSYFTLDVPFLLLVAALAWPWGLHSYRRLRRIWDEEGKPPHAWARPAGLAVAAVSIVLGAGASSYHFDMLTIPRAYDAARLGPPAGQHAGETRNLGLLGEFRWLPEAGVWIGTRPLTEEQVNVIPWPRRGPRKHLGLVFTLDGGNTLVAFRRVVDFCWRAGYRARGEGLLAPGWVVRPQTHREWRAGLAAFPDFAPQRTLEWAFEKPSMAPSPWTWDTFFWSPPGFRLAHRVSTSRPDDPVPERPSANWHIGTYGLRLVVAPAPGS
jgi:hypothetical protein